MATELNTEIKETAATLLQTLASFNKEQLNKVPFEGSWTAGQVGEHLIKAVSAEILYGNTTETERLPDVMVKPLRDQFLDFTIKMKSPDFILPSNGPHDKERLTNKLSKIWEDIAEAAETLDLTKTCLDFELPGAGHLTRLEWLNFMIAHTKRHTHQLNNISKALAA
ncbi:DinB family protein [Chitinophaga sp. SYP-B3965]|uniref:DinB family protein n=1 Tax=Chitinophaga sp. SYP-B3965 TaxID=2663120 RepID=UPI00129966F7|nr:DinB family protein [Chitinophaga sp. SYP-B3965]MRG48145.1 DinB family protein [Chitinophaga sp. SYP-B3965]